MESAFIPCIFLGKFLDSKGTLPLILNNWQTHSSFPGAVGQNPERRQGRGIQGHSGALIQGLAHSGVSGSGLGFDSAVQLLIVRAGTSIAFPPFPPIPPAFASGRRRMGFKWMSSGQPADPDSVCGTPPAEK